MEDIKIIIENILNGIDLISEDEAFLSEADFQLNFARCLDKHDKIENLILEYPFKSKDVYDEQHPYWIGKENKDTNKDKTYIDVYFKYNNEQYFVELKYKTAECPVFRHKKDNNKEFLLTNQGADNEGRYAIYEDIERVETIAKKQKAQGFVILLTNDKAYWSEHPRAKYSKNFLLLNNTNTCAACSFKCSKDDEKCLLVSENNKKKKNENKYQCGKHYLGYLSNSEKSRKRPLKIETSYSINWKTWKINKPQYDFQYLIIEIPKK